MNFENKNIVITGGASGIGKKAVERFLDEGANVCVLDINDEALDSLEKEVNSDQLSTIQTDISNEESCHEMAERLKGDWGVVDALINNAGWFPVKEFEEISYDEWKKVMAINLDGPFLMVKALLPLIKQSENGKIVNMASGSYFNPPTNQTHYVSAKAGVLGFTRALSRSLGKYKIGVNAIAPGLTVTKAVEETFEKAMLEQIAQGGSLKRDERPEDLVGAIVFLASEEAGFITGQTINVDGGRSFL